MPLRKGGFTLVELLVVIVIIAILAAILFPVFISARRRAQQSACISNMRQIAFAMQRYLDDWNGCFPDHASLAFPQEYVRTGYNAYSEKLGSYQNDHGKTWIQWFSHRYRYKNSAGRYVPAGIGLVLSPYVRNLAIFKCPSEWKTSPPDRTASSLRIPISWLDYDVGSSYYVKHALSYYAFYKNRPARLSEIPAPAKVTLMYEEQWHNYKDRPFLWDVVYWENKAHESFKRVGAIFTDCHVGTVDVLWHPASGFDGNWYFYQGSSAGHFSDISKGARDKR